jgi:hypothetical protein
MENERKRGLKDDAEICGLRQLMAEISLVEMGMR